MLVAPHNSQSALRGGGVQQLSLVGDDALGGGGGGQHVLMGHGKAWSVV